jgi:hypothetical protein
MGRFLFGNTMRHMPVINRCRHFKLIHLKFKQIYTYFVMMRQCFVLLLMILFSFQVLPVKKAGKVMNKVRSAEQLQNDDTDDSGDNTDQDVTLYNNDVIIPRFSYDVSTSMWHFENKISIVINQAEHLPAAQVTKIPSPPPDC